MPVNPAYVKRQAESPEGKDMAESLEALNWELQEIQFKLYIKQLAYEIKAYEYNEFLGYSHNEQEQEQHRKQLEEYNGYDGTI